MANMVNHSERAHAVLSASSAHRWMTCTAAPLLEAVLPDSESEAAKEGTLAHEMCELKLACYLKSISKRKLNAELKKLQQNELYKPEMNEHTDAYVDFIKGIMINAPEQPYVAVEVKVDFSHRVPDGFGTADCVMCYGAAQKGVLHIVDFKYGQGHRVSPVNNPQLMLYALGAVNAYALLYQFEEIRLSIFQPRLDVAETWSCSIAELLDFAKTAEAKAKEARQGGVFNPDPDACLFCKVRATCRARADEMVKLAFSDAFEKAPDTLDNSEIAKYIEQGESVAKWVAQLKDYALSECLAGREVPGYKAVEGRSTRAFSDMDKAFEKLKESGYPEELLYERKPLTLAQAEKAVGKKDFAELVGDFIIKAPGKPTLVPESDKRPAITNTVTAKEAFN